MAVPGLLITPTLHGQIKDTITKVGGMPIGGEVYKIPTELGGADTYMPKTFRVATFTGTWSIGDTKNVTLAQDTATTVQATNLFAPIGATLNTSESCAIAKDGTAWYLVSDRHGMIRGTFTAPWSKGASKTVTNVNGGGSVSATNYFAAVSGTGTKNCCVAWAAREWILIAAEC